MTFFKNLFKDKSIQKGLCHFINSNRSRLGVLAQETVTVEEQQRDVEKEFISLIKATDDILNKGSDSFQEMLKQRHNEKLSLHIENFDKMLMELDLRKASVRNALREGVAQYKTCLTKAEDEMVYESHVKKHNIGRSRDQMPQIDSDEDKQSVLDHFEKKVGITKTTKKLKKLKPSQNEINQDKVLSMLSSDMELDNEYIISNDGYMVDGHHRWAADLELDGDKKVDVIVIDLSIKDLLKRMNQLKVTNKRDVQDKEIEKGQLKVAGSYKLADIWKILNGFTATAPNNEDLVLKAHRVTEHSIELVLNPHLQTEVYKDIFKAFNQDANVTIKEHSDSQNTFTLTCAKSISDAQNILSSLATIVKAFDDNNISQKRFTQVKEKYGLTDRMITQLRKFDNERS